GLSFGTVTRSHSLRCGAITAENSDCNFEPHAAGCRRTASTGEQRGPSAAILLRDTGKAGATDVFVICQSGRAVFRSVQEILGGPNAGGIWVRGVSGCDGAKAEAADYRAGAQ